LVVSNDTLEALDDLGLNMYERKIYAALISRGVSTAGELSEMTGVPRSRSYDVLESLADKGFTILKPSKPMEYVAVPPGEAINNVKEVKKKELEEELEQIEGFKQTDALSELQTLYDEGVERVDPADMTGAIKGRYNVHKQVGNMFQSAQNEIKIMTTEDGVKEIHDNHHDLLEEAKEAGVQVRIAAPVTENNRSEINDLSKLADVRHLEDDDEIPKGRFMIVDNESVAMSLTDDEIHPTQDTVCWSESDHAAEDAMSPMFELVWNKSSDVNQ